MKLTLMQCWARGSNIRQGEDRRLTDTRGHSTGIYASGRTNWEGRCGACKAKGATNNTVRRDCPPDLGRVVTGCNRRVALRATEEGVNMVEEEDSNVEFCVMNFYHLVDVEDQDMELAAHKRYLENKDIKGRIFISNQGINAQFSGPLKVTVDYAEWIKQRKAFKDLKYSTFPSPGHAFPKLNVRTKALVSLLRDADLPITDPNSRATKVSPQQWKEMLGDANDPQNNSENKPIVIDVRNGYEWDVGHFKGAERPEEINFVDTPTGKEIYGSLDKIEKETPIMMYCTGGIRCDIYSTVMKKQGFKNLYTLEGGIQNYFRKEGDDLWNGSLYVFDSRMAVPTSLDAVQDQDKVEAAIPCELCGATAEAPHLNCANVDCNKLFLACTKCKESFKGCCCVKCTDAPRLLRPIKVDGYYSKMLTYTQQESGESDSKKQKKVVVDNEISA